MHDKSHRLVVTKAGSRRTVGLGSVWSVWLLAGWLFGLAVPVSSFELRPRYNNSLDYFALEEEESFRFGHFCHQYNWFGPTVVLPRACHGVACGNRQRRRLSSWQLVLRVQNGWMRSTTWVLALEGKRSFGSGG